MFYKCGFFFLIGTQALCAIPLDEGLQKVESYLIVGEKAQAVTWAKNLVNENPQSKEAHLSYIKALCQLGHEEIALEDWKKNRELFNDPSHERNVMEWVAWSVLSKAQTSPLMPIVLNALQGAAFTNDSKAIPLFLQQLKSSYAVVRAIAVRACVHFGDDIIKDEIRQMLNTEKIWYVRQELITAVGQLRMQECMNTLKEIASSPNALAEEKTAAIISIVNMTDRVDEKELDCLISSSRAGMRHLACALITHFERWDKLPALLHLLKDSSSDVQLAALNALSIASQIVKLSKEDQVLVSKLSQSAIPEVAITATWTGYINGDLAAEEKLIGFVRSKKVDMQRLATSAIATSGVKGALLASKLLDKVEDLYARFNLAWGMVSHRVQEQKALSILLETLNRTQDSFLMWSNSKNPNFNELLPSKVRHIDQIANYPKIIDQIVRLNILAVLSMRAHPGALKAVRNFLKNSDWGIVAEASALLVQEGEEAQIEEVRELLQDKDEHVRLQAALVLAFVGSDTQGMPVLMEVFSKMAREQKIQILFALGQIGDPQTIPFFLKIIEEPYQQLRVLAASCLIQTLYH